MDEVTFAIAVIGALTGVGSLGWQVFTWRQSQSTLVRLDMFRVDSLWLNVPTKAEYELLVITAHNASEHAVRITSVGLEARGPGGQRSPHGMDRAVWAPPPGATIPGLVQPHDEGRTSQVIAQDGVSSWKSDDELRAYVEVAGGERFYSEWIPQFNIRKTFMVLDQALPVPEWIIKWPDAPTV